MQVFGHLRFSYAGRSDAFLSKADLSPSAYRERLFDPARMAARMYLFEHICLPSLRAQTDQDFRLFILTSPDLPGQWREKLVALTADMPQIRILVSEAEHVVKAFDDATNEELDRSQPSIQFRLDDDDAMGCHMVATLKSYARQADGITILTAPAGLYVSNVPGQWCAMPQFMPHIAIGYALFNPAGTLRNPLSVAHFGFAFRRPSIVIPRIAGHMHVGHQHADTAVKRKLDYQNACLSFMSREQKRRIEFRTKLLSKNFPWTTHENLLSIMQALPG